MIASRSYAVPRWAGLRSMRGPLFGVLAVCVFFATLTLLDRPPDALLAQGAGMYRAEGDLRWTGSQAEFALAPHTGPTRLTLVLGFSSWPGRPATQVRLESDAGGLGAFTITAQRQHIQMLLPPGATFLRLHAALGRPPGDWRWLGVQVLSIDAAPSGLPTRAIKLALLCAAASVVLAWGFAWAISRGYGTLAALTLLGLALRLIGIAGSPPMIHRDEAVSLVDAWQLANTGYDHLGNFMPIAAFEAYGDWISPMLTYLLLPWMALFGPQPLVARIVVATFGALAIPAVYGLVRELRLPGAPIVAALVATLSPWQIFLSRVAIPPALVATTWSLCLWAAMRFVRLGRRRDAFGLAVAAGLTLYAYPTMKLAVPLLVLLAAGLAAAHHGWRALARWAWPALVLGLLWAPFVSNTLFNPSSGARFQLVSLKAESASQWLALWWQNYVVYFLPRLYYSTGGIRKIVQAVPQRGLALGAEALLLLGLGVLPIRLAARRWRTPAWLGSTGAPWPVWLLLVLAIVLAPLPASVTSGNPHVFRAAALAPLYAVLVGLGAAVEWQLLAYLPQLARAAMRTLAAVALGAALLWQFGAWYDDLLNAYPAKADSTWFFADSELEAMRRVVAYAPGYDQIWIDARSVGRPYIFLLASAALPPEQVRAQLVVERNPPEINSVTRLGSYYFYDFASLALPAALPTIEALPTSNGLPGYVIQAWHIDGRRVLILRGMPTEVAGSVPAAPPEDEDAPTLQD